MKAIDGEIRFTSRSGPPSASRFNEVYDPNGVLISRHVSEFEAVEAATRYATRNEIEGDYEIRTPNKTVSIRLLNPAVGGQAGEAPVDVTPPLAPVGGALSNFTATSVRLNWNANGEPDVAEYRIYKSTTSATTGFALLPTAVTAPFTNFTDNAYNPLIRQWYRLTAVDNVGNESEFSATFTDITPPAAPAAPTTSAQTSTTITITFPTAVALDHASWRVLVGGNLVASGITTATYQIGSLSPETSYSITLQSVDVSGNISAAGSALSASTTAAPVVGDNASRINTLLAGRSPHFSYNTPADPVTTREVTVTSAAQFNAESSTGNVVIRINSSFSGDIVLRSNTDVIMSNSATITGNLTLGSFSFRCSGARWTGGNINGRLLGNNFQDVLFDDFSLNSGNNFNDLTSAARRFERIAFINSTLQNSGYNQNGDGWVLFMLQRGQDPHQDFIFGNSKIIGDARHVFRVQSVDRIVFFDSVFNPTGTGQSGMRLHDNTVNVWIRDSWVRGNFHINGGFADDGFAEVVNGRFDNLDRYENETGLYAFTGPNPTPNSGIILNSRLHTTFGAGDGTFDTGSMTYGSGNDRVAWDGSTVPDYSNVGAIR